MQRSCLSARSIRSLLLELIAGEYYIHSYYKELICTKHLVLGIGHISPIARILCSIIAVAWLCEKMKVNLKIKGVSYLFENDVIVNHSSQHPPHFESDKRFLIDHARMAWHGACFMRSDYGYKVLSKLVIKKELQECGEQWFNERSHKNWVVVHFRGTDFRDIQIQYKSRYRLMPDDYIIYLQNVLNEDIGLFVCSDQQQFVEKMYATFPGRVFARNIQRSKGVAGLHEDPQYMGIPQKKDAMIDLLLIAKSSLVYTTGSGFVDAARFLNPSIRIISLDERWISIPLGRGSANGLDIPNKDLFKKLVANYCAIHQDEKP